MNLKKLIAPALILLMGLTACEDRGGDSGTAHTTTTPPTGVPQVSIELDTANKMIMSYLNSINYAVNDTDLHSLIFNADSLRAYLSDTRIVKVKLMFAHTLEYVNSGGQDQNVGYNSGKLTLIVAGFDEEDNYLYMNQSGSDMVLNHGSPCPAFCPAGGTATADLLR